MRGHTNWVNSAEFSPEGQRIVSASYDKTVRVWDSATCEGRQELAGHGGLVASARFSADGGRIVSGGGDRTVRVWDAATGA
jgi:WD40 repeat protein